MNDENVHAKLTHVDDSGAPRMVDVSAKKTTVRTALACTDVVLPGSVARLFVDGDLSTKKGPVVHTAIVAGTMAVKKTAELIPFCHPLAIERCRIDSELSAKGVLQLTCEVGLSGKTGVEMEALTGVTVAALTVYDMLKALSHDIVITNTRLIRKTGGKSDIGDAMP